MLQYRYDTQLLIDGDDLDEQAINDYIRDNIPGDSHYHTNVPWKVLEYCATLGDIYDIVVENMERQSSGLHG